MWQEGDRNEILEHCSHGWSTFDAYTSNACEQLDLAHNSRGFDIVLRVLAVVESFVTKKNN